MLQNLQQPNPLTRFLHSTIRQVLHSFHMVINILYFPTISRHNLLWRASAFRAFLRPACPTIELSEVLAAEERRYAKDEKSVGAGLGPDLIPADGADPAQPHAAAQAF